ncbi:DUF2017 family protein [Salinibacterium soli]|uniref:DUF2017 family protein n=1 Tax=Antiquaquibacter soli TaxID=3064523 RepID=UPI00272D86A8|nr:DUF2017 family protein [Protaetiibacter sp. WY-16]
MIPFSREGDDLVASFTTVEVGLLSELLDQLGELLAFRDDSDPALARLVPDAYRDDPEAASEFRRLMADELVGRKEANARALRDSLAEGRVRLSPAQVQSWLRSLTDLRLVIASRLGIENDDDRGADDPFLQDVYGWLGYVQSSILDALED